MYTYEELKQQRASGKKLSWKDIEPDQLRYLFIDQDLLNGQIADLYGVTPAQVSTKRQKWRILHNEKTNKMIYENIFSGKNAHILSKALTEYIFSKGLIQDMHAEGKLTKNDVQNLRTHVSNCLTEALKMIPKCKP